MHATATHHSKSQDAGLVANKLSQVHLDIPKTIAGDPIYTGNVSNAIRNGDGKYDYYLVETICTSTKVIMKMERRVKVESL